MKVFSLLLLLGLVYCRPSSDKKQELVGKIIDLIKREEIKLNLIETRHKSVETTTAMILEEVEELFEKNSVTEVEEALNVVTEALKAEPIFSKQIDIETNEITTSTTSTTTPAPTIEDIMTNVYTALPKEVQETIKTGYERAVER